MSDDDTPPEKPPEERRRRRRSSGPVTKGGDARAAKSLHEKVKSARGRKLSSTRWLQRQLNDPYVQMAKQDGYRSRAAYKLKELDERFHLVKKGDRVVDLGAAPGGWVQVALEKGAAEVVGVDLLEIDPIPGSTLMQLDFSEADAPEKVKAALGGPANAVLSDLAPWTTGHRSTDHLRIIALVELAAEFALETLKPGGVFVAKVFQGGTEDDLLAKLKPRFQTIRHAKPPASRSESAETYLIAKGFRG